jgi:hypothetical protein
MDRREVGARDRSHGGGAIRLQFFCYEIQGSVTSAIVESPELRYARNELSEFKFNQAFAALSLLLEFMRSARSSRPRARLTGSLGQFTRYAMI